MSAPIIHFPTEEEDAAVIQEALSRMKLQRAAHRAAASCGQQALGRLMDVLRENHHTGQPYKLRRLLFSLWNGKPADLTDTLCLDWKLKQDFARVLIGFGYEDKEVKFFYSAIEGAFRDAGLLDWFREEGGAS